ncbi:hypothetical protein GH5_06544 [Leishmania sp. Ghana 2012 LV757]|uniref:hypothetical protein n=1 Tax=Leishmania sp. Ghana 2012 LV757 TaxID=2803181 RepID=UPI001B449145|nr:hypothetical protein GH5_06544 [Leishmania sp. Ghana 2012 LV757]
MPPPRDVNFGIYDMRRPATSPTRRGGRGRRASHLQPLHGDIMTAGSETGRSFKRLRAAPLTSTTSSSAPSCSPFPPSSAQCPAGTFGGAQAASSLPRRGGAAPLTTTRSATGSVAAASAAALLCENKQHRGWPPPSCACSASSLSVVEDRVRWLVHPVGAASLLPAPLQDILANVLRILQQERAQLKGQRPCRRHARPIGTGVDADVTECFVHAAQAPSLVAAADIFSAFVSAHPTEGPALLSSPVVLVGAALAELVILDGVASRVIPAPQLLFFLDAAIAVGHPGAMHTVAVCLREGTAGLQRDAASSETWLRCAAVAGYLPAMQELGETYERGAPAPSKLAAEGGEDASDWGEAMRWYRRAAEAGYPPSQLNLGKLLLMAAEHAERGGTASAPQVAYLFTEAKRWLQACAATGLEEAVRLRKRVETQVGR